MKEEEEDIEDEEVFEKEGANRRWKENKVEKEKEKQCCQMYRKNKKIYNESALEKRSAVIYLLFQLRNGC